MTRARRGQSRLLGVPAHRGNGYATAVVLRAAREARAEGADLVFLVADGDDWPKELYRKLGFDTVGRLTKFFLTG